jgi:hypothetical protein
LFLCLLQVCWNLQVSRVGFTSTYLLEKAFMPAASSGGYWQVMLLFFIFLCNLVSRLYVGSLGCARDECLDWLIWLGLFYLILFNHFVFPLGYCRVRFIVHPIFVSSIFI